MIFKNLTYRSFLTVIVLFYSIVSQFSCFHCGQKHYSTRTFLNHYKQKKKPTIMKRLKIKLKNSINKKIQSSRILKSIYVLLIKNNRDRSKYPLLPEEMLRDMSSVQTIVNIHNDKKTILKKKK